MERLSLAVSIISMIAGMLSAYYARLQVANSRRVTTKSPGSDASSTGIHWKEFRGDIWPPLVIFGILAGIGWVVRKSDIRDPSMWGLFVLWVGCGFLWLLLLLFTVAPWLDEASGKVEYVKNPRKLRASKFAGGFAGAIFIASLIIVVPSLL